MKYIPTQQEVDEYAQEVAFEHWQADEDYKAWVKHSIDCAKLSELGLICENGCAPRYKVDLSIPF